MKTRKIYTSVALLALALVFGSCEKEIPGGKGTGVWIAVKANLLGVQEGGSNEAARSGGAPPQTFFQQLSEGLSAQVSIERDDQPLRAATTLALEAGKKYRLMAFRSGELISLADCTVGASDNPSLHVPENEACNFYCISYHSGSLPAAPAIGSTVTSLSIDNSNDLLWWRENNRAITTGNDELNITLTHRLTKLRILIDSSLTGQNITGISPTGITIGSVTTTGGTLSYSTGAVSGGTAGNQTLATWTGSGQLRKDSLRVFPSASTALTLSFGIGSVTMATYGNLPVTQKSVTFPAMALVQGASYTLRVRIRAFSNKFASSNIYWDDITSRLTFAPYSATPSTSYPDKYQYQGVFFKWGSLIGVSPKADYSYTGTYPPLYFYSGSNAAPNQGTDGTLIYVPVNPGGGGTTWTKTNTSTFTNGHVPNGTSQQAAWDSIPYAGDANYNLRASDRWPYVTFDGSADTGTSEVTDLGASHYADYVGDICRYISSTQSLGGSYRLPRSEEYASMSDNWSCVGSYSPAQGDDAFGIYSIPAGIQFGTGAGAILLPDSGDRGVEDHAGSLTSMSPRNTYRTSTVYDTYRGYTINFYLPSCTFTLYETSSFASRYYAGPVRCVRE